MKSVQSTLFVSILILILGVSVQAQADPSSQPNTLSAHDLELLFEQDGEPLQLALLSEQEMRETKGAWFYLYGMLYGGGAGGYVYLIHTLFTPDFSYTGFAKAVAAGAFGGLFGVTRGGQVILGAGASAMLGRLLDSRTTEVN